MGELAYNYLAHETEEYFTPHFSGWLGHPLLPGNTSWSMDIPLGYVSEQSTPDFTVPPPLYVARS